MKLHIERRSFQLPNKSDTIDATVIVSSHHIELSPADSGNQDRIIVQEVIKNIAENQHMDTGTNSRPFKVVILNEVDQLTREAQHALRRTMEKYMTNCRLILNCSSLTKVIEALRSRCLCIRVSAPSKKEIIQILFNICKKEGYTIPDLFAQQIANKSSRNLRRAILMLEASKVKQFPFVANQQVQQTEWETFIYHISQIILEQQSPAQLMTVREKFFELLTHCIPESLIFQRLTSDLLEQIQDNDIKFQLVSLAALYVCCF